MIVALLPQRLWALTGALQQVGALASVFALAYLLTQLLIGLLSDRAGYRTLLVAGYGTCAVAGLLFHTAADAPQILLARALQGIGEAPVWTLGPAMLAMLYPEAPGRAIGRYNAAIHAGLMLGPLAGLILAGDERGGAAFLAFSGLALLGGLATLLLLPEPRSARHAEPRPGLPARSASLHFWTRPLTLVLLAGIFLYGSAYGVFVSVLPVYLGADLGLGRTATTFYFSLFYAALGLGQYVGGPWIDRLGWRGFFLAGAGLAAAGLAAVPASTAWLALLPLALASAGLGLLGVAGIVALNATARGMTPGATSAGFFLFWGSGYALAPLVAASAPGAIFIALPAALLVIAVLLWRRTG